MDYQRNWILPENYNSKEKNYLNGGLPLILLFLILAPLQSLLTKETLLHLVKVSAHSIPIESLISQNWRNTLNYILSSTY